jgi:succinyl-CoA synthetase alpha subunit
MSIYVDENTRVVVQGITGREGRFHARQCMDYGTRVVAGVTPGKGGQEVEGVPVYDTVAEAAKEAGANCSLIFVPPTLAADAILEAVEAGMDTVVTITEGIPVLDMLRVKTHMRDSGTRLIGPNCPGIISPGRCKVGIMPGAIHKPGGPVGVVSRSGTLTYEVVDQLTKQGIGQSTCIGIGGDPVNGTSFLDVLAAFERDPETSAVLLVGEIGGDAEERAAEFAASQMTKPVAGFVAGLTAPPGRRMGHAGAVISGGSGTAGGKIEAMRRNGVSVCEDLGNLGACCGQAFRDVL